MGLADNIAILTGAAQRIGRSIADRFTKEGAWIASVAAPAAAASYNASKAGVQHRAKNAAVAYAKQNIRVNSIVPGTIHTPILDEMDKDTVASERKEMSPSRLQELSSDDADIRDDPKASPVQREYTRTQELIAWALTIAILVISVITFYLLWAKAMP
jgi:NAD(P)-dependent dehydrogenase (short-subunit alcohol dehydrogenase family)